MCALCMFVYVYAYVNGFANDGWRMQVTQVRHSTYTQWRTNANAMPIWKKEVVVAQRERQKQIKFHKCMYVCVDVSECACKWWPHVKQIRSTGNFAHAHALKWWWYTLLLLLSRVLHSEIPQHCNDWWPIRCTRLIEAGLHYLHICISECMCVCVCWCMLSVHKNYPTAVHYDFQLKRTCAGKGIRMFVYTFVLCMYVCVMYIWMHVCGYVNKCICIYMQPVCYARAHIFS